MYLLSDIFIGNYPVTQAFGANPASYAQFGIKGHDGIDFGCPTGTLIVAAADGWVKEVGNDTTGYGNYVKIVHNGYFTLYGHLQNAEVKLGDKVLSGQLIGISDNTGKSTGPHLHLGVAPCDAQGNKTEINNGFVGYIDPFGVRCMWRIKNITSPVQPVPMTPQLSQDDIRALTVLYQAMQSLKTTNGQSFGDIEGMVRELVAAYPIYEHLVSKLSS